LEALPVQRHPSRKFDSHIAVSWVAYCRPHGCGWGSDGL